MSRISDCLYGDLETVDTQMEISGEEEEVRAAIQNLCRYILALEKRIKSLEESHRK